MAYAARHEMCESAEDFLARRTRLAFVDVRAAEEALPRVRPSEKSLLLMCTDTCRRVAQRTRRTFVDVRPLRVRSSNGQGFDSNRHSTSRAAHTARIRGRARRRGVAAGALPWQLGFREYSKSSTKPLN